jgi:ribose transport system permease protein
VRTRRVLIVTYAIAGVLAALTGFLMTARIGSGQATIGGTMALETIAAAVIGGVSLRGGVGRVELVALAALFLAIIANAMNLLQLDSKYQTLVLGVVLILALEHGAPAAEEQGAMTERIPRRGARHRPPP